MNQMPKTSVRLDDFAGLWSNVDPRDIPDNGAVMQVNVGVYRIGVLDNRPVLREVFFNEPE